MTDAPLTWVKPPKAFTNPGKWWIRKIDGTWQALTPQHVINGRPRRQHHFTSAQAAWAYVRKQQ